MSISKCIVRLKDSHDTEHSVVVYAESLYEAVVRGLNLLGNVGWESVVGVLRYRQSGHCRCAYQC